MKHPVDVHVGKRLRHRRWMLGKTQQQIATTVGIKFQQIQKYETGMNRVSASRLWELANSLEVPVSYFFDSLEEVIGADSAERERAERTNLEYSQKQDLLSDREALELVRAYYSIPEAQRRRLFDLTRALGAAA